jgi:microcystin-dependent protein
LAGAFAYNTIPTNAPKGSAFAPSNTAVIPTGVIEMFAGSTAPDGWLICNGSTVSRSVYQSLFKVIGTTYGAGNSNTTFTLPDMRGRCPMGVGSGPSLTTRALAATAGAETATLAITNLPSHTHTATIGADSPTHAHTSNIVTGTISTTGSGAAQNHQHYFSHTAGTSGSYGLFDSGTASSSGQPNTGGIQQNHTHVTTVGFESANHTHTFTSSNTPATAATAFGIMPPSIVINFIIKI